MNRFTPEVARTRQVKRIAALTLATISLGAAAFFAAAADFRRSAEQPQIVKTLGQGGESPKATVTEGDPATYIVQFVEPAVASYSGGIGKFKATSIKGTNKPFLKIDAPESKSYANHLKASQKDFVQQAKQAAGRSLKVIDRYQYALNAMAIELTADEAKAMAKMPNVKNVTRERMQVLLTDEGPNFIGANRLWAGYEPFGFSANRGEGAVIAILDSGINHDHPSFADVGDDGYDHTNPLGDRNYIPGSYCDVVQPLFCNDKLIGAWDFIQDSEDPNAPEDDDGHGSHTASTAAGNYVRSATLFAPTTELTRSIHGVAPHANIIAYDVCAEGEIAGCPEASLLGALDQVIIDASALPNGIHGLNYSISGGGDPYNDPIELAFLNVTEAGVFVSTSAGNGGPGLSTTGHNSPWVTNVAALTHSRRLDNSLVDLTSNGASLPPILGAGFTAGYGPAPIVYAGDFPTDNGSANDDEPEQCLEPFPPGHFNGEIVVCDRGTIARVAKGENVLAGGAGGMVLANAEENGDSTVVDAHVLPAVHIGYNDGVRLKNWLASETDSMATITGVSLDVAKSNGDILADFSSRGPNLALDIIKPDVGAPGVSIIAAGATAADALAPEFEIMSGTSMSSPHNAGGGALVRLITGWTPYEVKSALMMTANRSKVLKEDGVTPVDPFDIGAGRINLKNVLRSGLVLNETGFDFLQADPDEGGDPKTLNIASMQDSECIGSCFWQRTVTNKSGQDGFWQIRTRAETGGLELAATPDEITLLDGESATIRVTADNTLAADGWNFGELELRPDGGDFTNLHMPVAVQTVRSSDPNLSKTVDQQTTVEGEILTYTINYSNGPLDSEIQLTDQLPEGLVPLTGSFTEIVTRGTTTKSFGLVSASEATWSGSLDIGGLELSNSGAASPAGFLPLASLGVEPFGCPANCDDGGVIVDVPAFSYNGQTYDQVIFSVNGTLEAGSESGIASSNSNQNLPDTLLPNNIIAPFWTDLNLGVDGDGAEWYAAVIDDSVGNSYSVYEWNNVPLFGAEIGDPATSFSFQIWVQNGDSGNIWITYGPTGNTNELSATVGVENEDGTVGDSLFFNGTGTAPAEGDELIVEQIVGGTVTLSFQARVDRCRSRNSTKVNRVELESGDVEESAIAVTRCSSK